MMTTKHSYFIRDDGNLKKINLDEIVFLEADANYVKFYALHYSYMVRTSLDAALKLLPANEFAQTNRSFVISLRYLDTIRRDTVIMDIEPKLEIPLSPKFYKALVGKVTIIETSKVGKRNKRRSERI
jgi:DNA-binding LytR/AlgR family response regulator